MYVDIENTLLLLFWFLYTKGAVEMIGLEEIKNVNRVLMAVTV